MGRIAVVRQWIVQALSGLVNSDPGGGETLNSQYLQSSGEDAPPLPGDYQFVDEAQGTGATYALGVVDGKNALQAAPGERRTYSRNSEGAIMATFFMRADGSATISNSNGSHTLAADGSQSMVNGAGSVQLQANGQVSINGLTISPQGQLTDANGIPAARTCPRAAKRQRRQH